MAHAHVQRRVAIEHAAEHQRRDGEALLVAEAQPEVAVEAGQALVPTRAVDAVGRRVQQHRHVELGAGPPHRIEGSVVERPAQVGAEVRRDQPELPDGPVQLGDGRVGVLHRELGEAGQPVGRTGHELRHPLVVPAAEPDGEIGLDVGQVRERVRREHLEGDVALVHRRQPTVEVHERAVAVAHALEHVVPDAEARLPACRRVPRIELGTERSCRAERRLEHHVGVEVDHRRATAQNTTG